MMTLRSKRYRKMIPETVPEPVQEPLQETKPESSRSNSGSETEDPLAEVPALGIFGLSLCPDDLFFHILPSTAPDDCLG